MSEYVETLSVWAIAPSALNNDRVAFQDAALEELAKSIAAHGLVQPITVRPVSAPRTICAGCYADTALALPCAACGSGETRNINIAYELVAGERRWRAHLRAGLATVRAIVRSLTDEEADAVMALENINRVDLNALEEARMYKKRMQRYGYSAAAVAQQLGKPERHVQQYVSLLRLIPEAQSQVVAGALPVRYGVELALLSENEQRGVMAALANIDGMPTITRFRAMVGAVVEQRDQLTAFDLEAFSVQMIATLEQSNIKQRETGLPVNAALPKMTPKPTDNVGRALRDYVARLQSDGHETEALAVSTVLDQLIRLNYTNI